MPAIFSSVDSITNLDLTFKDVPVNIPAWMDNIEITNFTIRFKGNMSEEEEVQLRQRFPQATIINDEEKSAPIRQQLLAVPQKWRENRGDEVWYLKAEPICRMDMIEK